MLFIFLLDTDESMNSTKLIHNGKLLFNDRPAERSENNEIFYPSSMDGAIYFIQLISKTICDKLIGRSVEDEIVPERSKSNEHRFILMNMNFCASDVNKSESSLEMRSSWKDSISTLHEELKNISQSSRQQIPKQQDINNYISYSSSSSTNNNNNSNITNQNSTYNYINNGSNVISDQFNDFMKKFESSYFNCTHQMNGHFIWKESEGVVVFVLSDQKEKLVKLNEKLKFGWQRKFIFIQLHPESFKEYSNINIINTANNNNSNISSSIESIAEQGLSPDSNAVNHPSSHNHFPFFPVTNMRDSDQLAKSLFHSIIFDSFDIPNMELLGKGGWINVIDPIPIDSSNSNNSSSTIYKEMTLIRPQFQGRPKWPIPATMTDSNWMSEIPSLNITQCINGSSFEIPTVEFDEYISLCPPILAKAFSKFHSDARVYLSIETMLGFIPIGYCELLNDNAKAEIKPDIDIDTVMSDTGTADEVAGSAASKNNDTTTTTITTSNSFVKIFIGPFNFPKLARVLREKEHFYNYTKGMPQYYDYFLHSCLGEIQWNHLCKNGPKIWKNEFPLPAKFVESKNEFRGGGFKQKIKMELNLLIERCEGNHRLRHQSRLSTYTPKTFPSILSLQKDSNHLNRLQGRFKNLLSIFVASCDANIGNSLEYSQYQLSSVIFKHSLPVHQMTDFTENMKKKRTLRPLFGENERDLFHLLKEMPQLSEEMSMANFVSGDVFGNPYKKDKKMFSKRRLSASNSASASSTTSSTSEDSDMSESEMGNNEFHMDKIDEIDYKEMEDVQNEIILNGSIVNIPKEAMIDQNMIDIGESEDGCPVTISSPAIDIVSVEKLIRSPGGLVAKNDLNEALPSISSPFDLENLLNLCKKYRRVGLASLISARMESLSL